MSRTLARIAVLTLVYALALGSFDGFDLLFGALLATGLLLAVGERPAPIGGLGRRLVALPGLVGAVLRDIVVGTWQVAGVVLGWRELRRPGIVAVPFGDRTPNGAIVTGFVTTLAPGEFLVDIDWEHRRMLFHILEADDPDAVRERFADFYRRHQRHVAP